MSHVGPKSLESQIRDAVQSLPASPWRKRAMREELLAHLAGAYEQELAVAPDPAAALAAATTRFGNLDLIRNELLASVPPAERLVFTFLSKRELLMRRWTWIVVGIVLILLGTSIVLPALAQIKQKHAAFAGDVALAVSIGMGLVLLGFGSMGYAVARK